MFVCFVFFFKQKTAYEMRISDWSSDVCSSDLSRGGFRIEPFVWQGDELASWADVGISQSLQGGYLPIPGVAWKHPDFGLHVTAFAHGDAEQAQLVARYRLENTTDRPRAYTLALAIRPLQVNPPTQFLSTVGGVSRIDSISVGQIGRGHV